MIQETKTSVVYVGDGQQRSFPFPYRYYDAKDVVGYVENKGKWKRITSNYEYHDGGKSYEYPMTGAPLAKGVKLKLARETKQSQEYDFAEEHVEKALDKITMMLQEINRDGLVQVGVGDFDGVIPAGRPFAFLQYNADASGFDVVDLPDFAGEKKVLLAIRDRAELAADRAEAAAKRADEQVTAGAEVLNNSLATIAGAVSGGVARIETQTRQALNDVNVAAQAAEDKTKGAVQATQDAAAQAQKEIAAAQVAAENAKKEITDMQADVQNNLAQKQNEFNTRSNEILDKVGEIEDAVQRGEDAVASLQKYDGLEAAVRQAKTAYDQSVSRLETAMSSASGKVEELTQIETATKAANAEAQKAKTAAEKASMNAEAANRETQTASTAAQDAAAQAQAANREAQSASALAASTKIELNALAEQARKSEGAASASATQAKQSESAAATSAEEAKNAAKQAKQIAGGDFLTTTTAATLFADKSGTATALDSKANTADVYTKTESDERYLQKTDKIDAYTKAETDTTFATKTEVGTKANTTDVYTRKQSDSRYTQSTYANTTFATKAQVNAKANAADVYTKTQANAKYQLKGTYASVEYVDGRVANIVNSAPETLDTLQELAEALGNNPNFATTVANEIGTKADKATTENALKGKANAADVYTKTESDARYELKGNSIDFNELARRIPSWQWKVTLPKSDHQIVTATVGSKTYTDDFYAPQGSEVTFSAKADVGYIAGSLSTINTTLSKDLIVTITAAVESEDLEAGTKTFAVNRNYPHTTKTDSFIVPPKVYVLKWAWNEKEAYSRVIPGNKFEIETVEAAGMYFLFNTQGIDKSVFDNLKTPITVSWSEEINEHAYEYDWSK